MGSRTKWSLGLLHTVWSIEKTQQASKLVDQGRSWKNQQETLKHGQAGTCMGEGTDTGRVHSAGRLTLERGWQGRLEELTEGQARTVGGFPQYLDCPDRAKNSNSVPVVSNPWNTRWTLRPFNPASSNSDGKTGSRELGCVPTISSVIACLAFGSGDWGQGVDFWKD